MKISRYNPSNGILIEEDISGINFGNIPLGGSCNETIVIKPVPETEELVRIALYLENNDGLDHTRFGAYKSTSFITGILPNDSRINYNLLEANGVSDFSIFSDRMLPLDPEVPEYVWLSINVGFNEVKVGDSVVNYRFVFEYY